MFELTVKRFEWLWRGSDISLLLLLSYSPQDPLASVNSSRMTPLCCQQFAPPLPALPSPFCYELSARQAGRGINKA